MDRASIVRISNAYFNHSLGLKHAFDLLKNYCIEKEKSEKEATDIARFLTQNNVFVTISHKAFEFALKHYQIKFKVILLSRRVDLNAYRIPDFKNNNYILAY